MIAVSNGIPLEEQIVCVRREIAMRELVYPKRVREGRMKPETAERELMAMRAVLATLGAMSKDAG